MATDPCDTLGLRIEPNFIDFQGLIVWRTSAERATDGLHCVNSDAILAAVRRHN